MWTSIDPMDDVTPWQAFAADGVTPSTDLSIALDTSRLRPGAAPRSGRISANGALDHTLRRSLAPALDLGIVDEIRVAFYSNRVADGKPATPFFLELRLASAAMPLNDPANKWQRFLFVTQAETWDAARFSLGDLPPAIRDATSVMQLRCAVPTAFQINLDDVIGVRDEMIGDVDAALQLLLNNRLVLNGTAVPAVLHPANGALTQKRPYIEITNYDIVYSRERTESVRARGDFFDGSYSLRPPSNAYDLYYQIAAVADDRRTQSQMLEFILRVIPPRGEILVNNVPLQIDATVVNPIDQLGGFRTDALPLFFRIRARQEVGTSIPVRGASTLVVDGDVR